MNKQFILEIMKNILIAFIGLALSCQAMSMEANINDVSGDIESILQVSPENYFKDLPPIRKKIDQYLEQRKRICNGEFSILVIDDSSEEKKTKRRKLDKKERRLCISELKNIRVVYANNLFVARKKYLEYLHKQQIDSLLKIKDEVIKEIQSGK